MPPPLPETCVLCKYMQMRHGRGNETGSLNQRGFRLGSVGGSLVESRGRNSCTMRGTSNDNWRVCVPKCLWQQDWLPQHQQNTAPNLPFDTLVQQLVLKHSPDPPSLQPRAGGGKKKKRRKLALLLFAIPHRDSQEGTAKSTAVHGNPGSSVQSWGRPTRAAWGDTPQGGHFPWGLLKE